MTSPLSPVDCDVRGLEWMPLHGRMFGSRFYSLALRDPRAGLAAIKLWWEAWQQRPAGSLPNDDFDLARMADFGSDMRGWKKVRTVALHGFVECDDGRLYHPLIAAEAQDAWERRRRDRERKAAQRAKRWPDGQGQDADGPAGVPWDGLTTDGGQAVDGPPPVRSDRTGQDKTEKKDLRFPSDAEPACLVPAAVGEASPIAPPWPPQPLPSSATAVVGSVVASLSGRSRGSPRTAPHGPARTVEEQIAAVRVIEPKPSGISREVLGEMRRRAGVG